MSITGPEKTVKGDSLVFILNPHQDTFAGTEIMICQTTQIRQPLGIFLANKNNPGGQGVIDQEAGVTADIPEF